VKKCRKCKKAIRERKKGDYQKRLGLCAGCYSFDRNWVRQGMKLAGIRKTQ